MNRTKKPSPPLDHDQLELIAVPVDRLLGRVPGRDATSPPAEEIFGDDAAELYWFRILESEMTGAGLHAGHVIAMDASVDPEDHEVVVVKLDGFLTLRRLSGDMLIREVLNDVIEEPKSMYRNVELLGPVHAKVVRWR